MRRIVTLFLTLVLLLTSIAVLAESSETIAELGVSYDFDNVSARLIAYHVEQINGTNYLYVEYEFTNNGTAPLTFENAAWILVTQNDEECYIHTTEIPNIHLIDPCLPGSKATYTNAYILNDLTTEVVIEMFPTTQLLAGWGNRTGQIFYYIDIANEPMAIAEGYEWVDIY